MSILSSFGSLFPFCTDVHDIDWFVVFAVFRWTWINSKTQLQNLKCVCVWSYVRAGQSVVNKSLVMLLCRFVTHWCDITRTHTHLRPHRFQELGCVNILTMRTRFCATKHDISSTYLSLAVNRSFGLVSVAAEFSRIKVVAVYAGKDEE